MKKFLSVLLAACLLMAVFTSAALAEKGPKGPKGPGIKHEEKLENKQLKELQKMVDKAIESAGLDSDRLSTHKLRHTAATLMLRNGVDTRVLQEILGHSSLNTTQIYTHVESDSLRAAAMANPIGARAR